jgi:hypothetical protein
MDVFKFISGAAEPTILTEGRMIQNAKSIMWTERYREPGEFEIVGQLSSGLREFLPIGTLISHADTLEVMFVENHEIDEDENSDPIIKITGRSLEAYLENRIVGSNGIRAHSNITEYILAGNYTWLQIAVLINDHVNGNLYPDDNFINIVTTSIVTGAGIVEPRNIRPDELHKTVLSLLEIDDLGIKVIRRNTFNAPNGSSAQTVFCIHKGTDKSNSVIFSWKARDLDKLDYLWSDKKSKNSAMVIGRYVNTFVDTPGVIHYNRRTMIVNADDIDGNLSAMPSGAQLTDIVNKMKVRGNQALHSQDRITITRADISDISQYHYRRDFNMGDLVTLDGNFGQIAVMRVVEYVEIQDENGETGHPTFSVPKPQTSTGGGGGPSPGMNS